MRRILAGLCIATASALALPAQTQMRGLGGPITVETSEVKALGKLPKAARHWMTEEAIRQAQRPGDLDDIDADMQAALGEHLEVGARRMRMDMPDVISTIRYHVVSEAGRLLDEDIRARQKLAGKAPTDDAMLAIETAISHRHRIRALEEQAERRLTRKASAALAD